MFELLIPPIVISFSAGFFLGIIIGIIFMRVIQKSSMIPVLNGLACVVFLAVNIYGIIYTKDIPYIFNVSLALVFGLTSGVDIVKYLPNLKAGNKE